MIFALLLSIAAAGGSIWMLTMIAAATHSPTAPKSLSERAALEVRLLIRFRKVLLSCSTLFALAIYIFIAPATRHGWWIAAAWTIEYGGVIAAAFLPARGKTFYMHHIGAQIMGLGMALLAIAFWRVFEGIGSAIELGIVAAMLILGLLTYVDRRRFIFHELGFIYLSNLSIVLAALLI